MKSFKKFVVECFEQAELDEAVEVRHDRYMRSHGKKASGGTGSWMFTHKNMGDVDYNDEKEVYSAPRGKFSDAKKAAQQWGKKHGHSTVYVMEEVELDEAGRHRDYVPRKRTSRNVLNINGMIIPYAKESWGDWVITSGPLSSDPETKGPFKYKKDLVAAVNKKMQNEEVELDEVSTEKLRSYASAAIQDKNKAKADKRWKYASKAMNTVADREVKAAHARKYNKMEEVELDELDTTTLQRYKTKANRDIENSTDEKQIKKRGKGYALASKKLTSRILAKEQSNLDEGYLKYGVNRIPDVYVNRMPKTLQDYVVEYEGTRNSEMFAFTKKLKTHEVESLAKAVDPKLNIYSVKYHGSNKTSGTREVFVYEVKK